MRAVIILLFLAVTLGFSPLSARVGETLDQCNKRYGKAISTPQVYDFGDEAKDLAYFNFEKNGIAIQIGFLKGNAADLSFHHTGTTGELTQVEIDTLLAANSGGMTWKPVNDGKLIFFPDTPQIWTRYGNYQQRDDSVIATVDGIALHIFTPDWFAYVNDKMLAHTQHDIEVQKKNLEGF